MPKRFITCSQCGSERVVVDAWAEWNACNQEWQIDELFYDSAFCKACEDSTTIKDEEIN